MYEEDSPAHCWCCATGSAGRCAIAGIVLLVTNSGGFGVDGFALGVGGGLSLIMLNFLYRLGVSGDREREQEEDARSYLERHGYWPDEADEHRARAPIARPCVRARSTTTITPHAHH